MRNQEKMEAAMMHPLSGVGLYHWVTMLLENGGVSKNELGKAWKISLRSLRQLPARLHEGLRFGPSIARCRMEQPPVFLLGHWRSGTTFLENVLCRDPNSGYLTVVQSINPLTFLSREKQLIAEFGETKRYMDNVKLTGDAPSEEEVAMAVLAEGSFWHGYYFPSRFDHYFRKYVLLEGLSENERAAWKDRYLHLLKKLTLRYDGKRLILKNPPNTCRIPLLLELFPEARFVHIVRNPFEVYLSRMNQFKNAVKAKALQPISEAQWEDQVFRYYRELMTRHLAQRSQIPKGNYVEVRFEELKKNPLNTIAHIFDTLRLEGFQQAKPHFQSYLNTLKDYKQNDYRLPDEISAKIRQHWQFALDHWNYHQEACTS